MNKPQELVITDLAQVLPAITPSFGAALAEACAVCLEDAGHNQGVEITIDGDFNAKFNLSHILHQEKLMYFKHSVLKLKFLI